MVRSQPRPLSLQEYVYSGASYDDMDHALADQSLPKKDEVYDSQVYVSQQGEDDDEPYVYVPSLGLDNVVSYSKGNETWADSNYGDAFALLDSNGLPDFTTTDDGLAVYDFSGSAQSAFVGSLIAQVAGADYDDPDYVELATATLTVQNGELSSASLYLDGYDDDGMPLYYYIDVSFTASGAQAKEDVKVPTPKTGTADSKLALALQTLSTKDYALTETYDYLDLYDNTGTRESAVILSGDEGVDVSTFGADYGKNGEYGYAIDSADSTLAQKWKTLGDGNKYQSGEPVSSAGLFSKVSQISPLFFAYDAQRGGYVFDGSLTVDSSYLGVKYTQPRMEDVVIRLDWDTALGVEDKLLAVSIVNTIASAFEIATYSYVYSSIGIDSLPSITVNDSADGLSWDQLDSGIVASFKTDENVDLQETGLPTFGGTYLDWTYYYNPYDSLRYVVLSTASQTSASADISSYYARLSEAGFSDTQESGPRSSKIFQKEVENVEGNQVALDVASYDNNGTTYIKLWLA